MDSIRLKNFRCFRDVKSARLAPLTLLVGENSTGKTSFMAMMRILCEVGGRQTAPSFKQEPYDLGSFDEIAYRGANTQSDTFEVGLETYSEEHSMSYKLSVTFGRQGAIPIILKRRYSFGDTWTESLYGEDGDYTLRVGTSKWTWEKSVPDLPQEFSKLDDVINIPGFSEFFLTGFLIQLDDKNSTLIPDDSSVDKEDITDAVKTLTPAMTLLPDKQFAGAPVRSKPRRTYDPDRPSMDSEGNYVPMYLADMNSRDNDIWKQIKSYLEGFGQASGLFDEIYIRRLGEMGSDPFQIQTRKSDEGIDTPRHNLIDTGYGISQVLPVVTQLIRDAVLDDTTSNLFLIQQPEVHLHPSAQAALGSLFCQIAGRRNQIIVETHSDHLMDRVRMDARDGVGQIKPEDVSILYFERSGSEVNIHSLGVDDNGNVTHAPDSYRRFFMEETKRRLWP